MFTVRGIQIVSTAFKAKQHSNIYSRSFGISSRFQWHANNETEKPQMNSSFTIIQFELVSIFNRIGKYATVYISLSVCMLLKYSNCIGIGIAYDSV